MTTFYTVGHWVNDTFVKVVFKPGAKLFGTDAFQLGQDLSHFPHAKRRDFVSELFKAHTISKEVDFLQNELKANEYYKYINSLGYDLSGCFKLTDKSFQTRHYTLFVFLAKIET